MEINRTFYDKSLCQSLVLCFTARSCFTYWGEVTAQELIYYPISLRSSREINDTLSDRDILTGEGGFARDYRIYLEDGDQVAIDLLSDNFDALVILIAADGSTVAENDDGPDGTTNSLLFARIIGVIPLEALGLELDLQNQTLKVLPSKSLDTYLTIL